MELKDAQVLVVKVGTSTLTYENGKVNLRRLERLCRTLSDLQNAGRKLVLVSSGAIGVGMGKLGLPQRPEETEKKQALAAIGQCELMFLYDKFFGEYDHTVAQVLLTADVVDFPRGRENVQNTFRELLSMGVIPVVNENDTVETQELEGKNFGDNDTPLRSGGGAVRGSGPCDSDGHRRPVRQRPPEKPPGPAHPPGGGNHPLPWRSWPGARAPTGAQGAWPPS